MREEQISPDMGWQSDWASIRSASPAFGIGRLAADFEKDKSRASTALDLVTAHMWLRQYERAEQICIESESARPKSMTMSSFPVQRGAALWSGERFDDARIAWWQAAAAKYGDSAGANVHYLLLLFADSELNGSDLTRIREELNKKTSDRRMKDSWPAPIAMFQLGIFAASYITDVADDHVSRWQFEFYRVINTFGIRQQREAMKNELSVLLDKVESDTDLTNFVDYVRLPELHMAREIVGGITLSENRKS
jgi:hypothetical protein